jgi:integrase
MLPGHSSINTTSKYYMKKNDETRNAVGMFTGNVEMNAQ